jgi:hypothetical protein
LVFGDEAKFRKLGMCEYRLHFCKLESPPSHMALHGTLLMGSYRLRYDAPHRRRQSLG